MGTMTQAPSTEFYAPGQYLPEQSIGYLMNKVISSILAQADARLAQYKLTYVQWLPLYKLLTCESSTLASLSRDLSVDPAALTRSLSRLETKGLIRRERSTQDRRVVHLFLTEQGRTVAEHVPTVLADVLNGHLAGFEHSEWQQLLQWLTRMLLNGDAMKSAAPAAPPRSRPAES
jgi:DNA-binding MarR family transcriptional regulator